MSEMIPCMNIFCSYRNRSVLEIISGTISVALATPLKRVVVTSTSLAPLQSVLPVRTSLSYQTMVNDIGEQKLVILGMRQDCASWLFFFFFLNQIIVLLG
jgi:hypothetical protein